MTIELVTFDLDNTLWDVDTVIRRAEREMRSWIDPQVGRYNRMDAETLAEHRRRAVADDPSLRHDVTRMRLVVMERAFLDCGVPSHRAGPLASEAFEVFMQWRNKVEFFDGALDALELLSGRYQLAALTNGNADIARIGLDTFFSFAINAADVGASKPDPAMFLAALGHAGVAGSNAVHVGDNPVDDVEGATGAGFHSIWVNLNESPDATDATREVRRLDELERAIASIGKV